MNISYNILLVIISILKLMNLSPPSYTSYINQRLSNNALIQYILSTNNFDQLDEITEIINQPGITEDTKEIYLRKIKDLPQWQYKFLNAKIHIFLPPISQADKYMNLIKAALLISLISIEFSDIPNLPNKLKMLRREIYNLIYNDKKIINLFNIINEFENNYQH